jgi:hypothetical protein
MWEFQLPCGSCIVLHYSYEYKCVPNGVFLGQLINYDSMSLYFISSPKLITCNVIIFHFFGSIQ